jgi:hypothetical protein
MARMKKFIKYLILGGFVGILLVYLKFKRVNIKE